VGANSAAADGRRWLSTRAGAMLPPTLRARFRPQLPHGGRPPPPLQGISGSSHWARRAIFLRATAPRRDKGNKAFPSPSRRAQLDLMAGALLQRQRPSKHCYRAGSRAVADWD
jgi:hypothetical protein